MVAYYGPMPVDMGAPEAAVRPDAMVAYYGPMPVDMGSPERPDAQCNIAWYGPPPCQDDEQCVDMYGSGWYCDQGHTMIDPCTGDESHWPLCREGREER